MSDSKYDLEGATFNGTNLSVQQRMVLKVKYHAAITPLEQIDKGDWIDLRAAEAHAIMPGQKAKIEFGVSIKLPKNHEAHILARSSLFKKTGLRLTNGMGIVDETYCGNNDRWFGEFINDGKTPITIYEDQRIAQFRIMEKMPKLDFEEVDKMVDENRGGHGITGDF